MTFATIARNLKLAATAFATLLTITSTAPTAFAQVNLGQTAKVQIPFAFEVGSRHFEPGLYTLHIQSEHILQVQGPQLQGKIDSATLMINADSNVIKPTTGKAIFQHVDGKYFLAQLFTANSSTHLDCVKSPEQIHAQSNAKAERLARQSQPTPLTPESKTELTTLALLR